MQLQNYIINDIKPLNINDTIGDLQQLFNQLTYSHIPIEEIKTILLDYQSRTSVELLKLLLREYWDVNPTLVNSFSTRCLLFLNL